MQTKLEYEKITKIHDIYNIRKDINENEDFKDETKLMHYINSLDYAIRNNQNKGSSVFIEKLKIALDDFKYLYLLRSVYILKNSILPNHNIGSTTKLDTLINNTCDSIENLISEPEEYKAATSKIKIIKSAFDETTLTDEVLNKRLAEKTKESRKKVGLNQKTFASYIGISKYALNRIETNNVKIFNKITARKIANFFGYKDLNDFLDLVPRIEALSFPPPIFRFYAKLVTETEYTPFMENLAEIFRMGPDIFNEYLKYSDEFFKKYINDDK